MRHTKIVFFAFLGEKRDCMTSVSPFVLSDKEPFVIGVSDLSYFFNQPRRCAAGLVLFCESGTADMAINLRRGILCPNTIVLTLPGMTLMLENASSDLRVSYAAFASDLIGEAGFRLGPSFFSYLGSNPFIQVDEKVADGICGWFKSMMYTYLDHDNIFRRTIVKNRLQNILLEMYDKIQRNANSQSPTAPNRQKELFHKFISLVHENCTEQREVTFYADRLCISTRYLSAIVRKMASISAKELIDRAVIMEIKILLQNTTLPVQEISYKMHFPDQSYLGRFFKKHTGISPTVFRQQNQ